MTEFQAILGIVAIIATGWALSKNRRVFPWRIVIAGLSVQIIIAVILLKFPASQTIFISINQGIAALQQAVDAGTSLVFGYLGGAPLPFEESYPGAAFVFAFRALPLVIVSSAIAAVLYYWRILPWVVRGFGWLLGKALRLGGAASFATAANVFLGSVEAPLLIRPYLERLTRGDLFVLMVAGMSTIAGTVYVLYATILQSIIPDVAGHLLTASLISAPAAVMLARLIIPEDTQIETAEVFRVPRLYEGTMDALTQGTIAGLRLFAYIIGMVLVLVALVELVNIILGSIFDIGGQPLTMQMILGWILAPVAWLLGIPWSECFTAGQLLGAKVVLNELITYIEMASMSPEALSQKSRLILTYAMCGFANFGGLGVMLAGLLSLVPERRIEIMGLAMKTLVAGNLAAYMTAAMASLMA